MTDLEEASYDASAIEAHERAMLNARHRAAARARRAPWLGRLGAGAAVGLALLALGLVGFSLRPVTVHLPAAGGWRQTPAAGMAHLREAYPGMDSVEFRRAFGRFEVLTVWFYERGSDRPARPRVQHCAVTEGGLLAVPIARDGRRVVVDPLAAAQLGLAEADVRAALPYCVWVAAGEGMTGGLPAPGKTPRDV